MPRVRRFSDRRITNAPVGRTHVDDTPNLYVYKSPKGVIRYFYRYTVPRKGKVTETSVGRPGITLSRAKQIAAKYREWLTDGIDPQEAKRWEKVENTTLGDVAKIWIERNKPDRSDSWLINANNLLRHVESLLSLPLTQVSPDKITEALLPLYQRGLSGQAMNARRLLEQVLDFAKAKRLLTYMGQNPARWEILEHLLPRRKKTPRKHYAAMPYTDVPAFVQALRQRQGRATGAVCLEFVILTASRSSEALKMRWSELDWEQKLWNIPAERTKARREHRVPLSDRAIELLARQKEHSTGGPFVFTGYSQAPLAEKAMLLAMRKMGASATVHGFRSAFRDWAGDTTTFARETIEECLAHKVGNAVENAYRRSDALQKRRQIVDAWAAYIAP
jgi:integrase